MKLACIVPKKKTKLACGVRAVMQIAPVLEGQSWKIAIINV